jgi:hypothetical protein
VFQCGVFGLVIGMMSYEYNACLTHFCIWVHHLVCPVVVEEEKKDQIYDQNGSEPNQYVNSKDIRDS